MERRDDEGRWHLDERGFIDLEELARRIAAGEYVITEEMLGTALDGALKEVDSEETDRVDEPRRSRR